VTNSFSSNAVLLVSEGQCHVDGLPYVIQRTRGGVKILSLAGGEAYIRQGKSLASSFFLPFRVGVLAGPTEEEEGDGA
jgi:hypothetical protein